jgi:hypothetical protein
MKSIVAAFVALLRDEAEAPVVGLGALEEARFIGKARRHRGVVAPALVEHLDRRG